MTTYAQAEMFTYCLGSPVVQAELFEEIPVMTTPQATPAAIEQYEPSGMPPPRANQDGSECPSWCVTDHEEHSFHASETVTAEAPEYHFTHVRALDYANETSSPFVEIMATGMLDLAPRYAENLAALIDQLAAAPPERHRALAAAIRQVVMVAKTR